MGRVGRLKRFLAPQLAELIVSQGNEKILESHRRDIVVVFCDLRGYTAFTETAEPEEVLELLREYHSALGPLVSQFEGTLDQFSGDGIMVFFNDPVPIPDPAARAVKMAGDARSGRNADCRRRERGRDIGEEVWTSTSRRRRKRSKPQFGAGSQICRKAVSVPIWRCGVEVKLRSREAGRRRRRAWVGHASQTIKLAARSLCI